jgi:alpha-glucosidase
MYERWIQTLDPDRFALDKVQYVVNTLKESGRDFIVMVDPAVFSGTPNSSVESYETYQTGVQQDIFMKLDGGDIYEGVVWPGPTAFPDWTHPNAQQWWTQEFDRFFNNETGFDVSGIWLDMNEPANFLPYVSQAFYIPTDILAGSKHLPSVA